MRLLILILWIFFFFMENIQNRGQPRKYYRVSEVLFTEFTTRIRELLDSIQEKYAYACYVSVIRRNNVIKLGGGGGGKKTRILWRRTSSSISNLYRVSTTSQDSPSGNKKNFSLCKFKFKSNNYSKIPQKIRSIPFIMNSIKITIFIIRSS